MKNVGCGRNEKQRVHTSFFKLSRYASVIHSEGKWTFGSVFFFSFVYFFVSSCLLVVDHFMRNWARYRVDFFLIETKKNVRLCLPFYILWCSVGMNGYNIVCVLFLHLFGCFLLIGIFQARSRFVFMCFSVLVVFVCQMDYYNLCVQFIRVTTHCQNFESTYKYQFKLCVFQLNSIVTFTYFTTWRIIFDIVVVICVFFARVCLCGTASMRRSCKIRAVALFVFEYRNYFRIFFQVFFVLFLRICCWCTVKSMYGQYVCDGKQPNVNTCIQCIYTFTTPMNNRK